MSNEVGTEIPDDEEFVDDVASVDESDQDDVDDEVVDADDDVSDTVILSDSGSDDDDTITTAEINVERLIAELGDADEKDACRKKEIRRRLEELAEEKSFEDTYAVEFGSD